LGAQGGGPPCPPRAGPDKAVSSSDPSLILKYGSHCRGTPPLWVTQKNAISSNFWIDLRKNIFRRSWFASRYSAQESSRGGGEDARVVRGEVDAVQRGVSRGGMSPGRWSSSPSASMALPPLEKKSEGPSRKVTRRTGGSWRARRSCCGSCHCPPAGTAAPPSRGYCSDGVAMVSGSGMGRVVCWSGPSSSSPS
jgi:hypothetical protein